MNFQLPTQEEIDRLNDHAYSLRHQDTNEALSLAEQALANARQIDHQKGLAYAIFNSSLFKYILGMDVEEIRDEAFQALGLFQSLEDVDGQGWALNLIGHIFRRTNAPEQSLKYYVKSLALFETTGNQRGLSAIFNNIGLAHFEQANYGEALAYFSKSLQIAETDQDSNAIAYAISNIARIHAATEEYDKAVDFHLLALQHNQSTDDRAFESSTRADVGLIYSKIGENLKAVEFLRSSIQIANTTGNAEDNTLANLNLGSVYLEEGELDKAEDHLQAALDLATAGNLFQSMAETHLALGKLYIAKNQQEIAFENFESGLKISERARFDLTTRDIHAALSKYYEALQDWQKAYNHYHLYHALAQKIFNKETEKQIRNFSTKSEFEQIILEAEAGRQKNFELEQALTELKLADQEKTELLLQLESQAKVLQQLAREDGLTGLANRRWLDVKLAEEFDRAKRFNHPLVIAMLDIDDFKLVNDTISHQIGDQVLIQIAKLIQSACNPNDVVGRYGGEEFQILFIESKLEDALKMAEAIRTNIENYPWDSIHPKLSTITISIGLGCSSEALNPSQVTAIADEQLYNAKKSGKNKVCAPNP